MTSSPCPSRLGRPAALARADGLSPLLERDRAERDGDGDGDDLVHGRARQIQPPVVASRPYRAARCGRRSTSASIRWSLPSSRRGTRPGHRAPSHGSSRRSTCPGARPTCSSPAPSAPARRPSCSAHTRFLSIEPLLGAIPDLKLAGIDWVIIGGESGPGARPVDPACRRRVLLQAVGRDEQEAIRAPARWANLGRDAQSPLSQRLTSRSAIRRGPAAARVRHGH